MVSVYQLDIMFYHKLDGGEYMGTCVYRHCTVSLAKREHKMGTIVWKVWLCNLVINQIRFRIHYIVTQGLTCGQNMEQRWSIGPHNWPNNILAVQINSSANRLPCWHYRIELILKCSIPNRVVNLFDFNLSTNWTNRLIEQTDNWIYGITLNIKSFANDVLLD